MLKSKAKWHFQQSESKLSTGNNATTIVKDILKERGLKTDEEMDQFLHPSIDQLISSSKLLNIDIAKERINQAIKNKEKILIFGDYDADGVCSTTILLKALKELGAMCDYYIPNRFTEGYGPNEEAFKRAYEQGIQLIITVDTGISALSEAKLAKKLGMDLIITDHHEIQEQLPEALAVIHPKISNNYPFKDLAGAGVAFKLAQYVLGYFPEHLLDLVAVGTIADLVPLIGENRVLSYFGLKQLANTNNLGFQALKEVCNIDGDSTEEDIGFLIAPRLNAVGRLQNASLAVELLMTTNLSEARKIATEINQLNQDRQQIVNEIIKEIERMLVVNENTGVIMVHKPGWNEGVLGIVASRLVQKYNRPAIVLTLKEESMELKGSARSIASFDLFHHCMQIRELFTEFGGHSQAAGMTFPLKNLETIQTELDQMVFSTLKSDFRPTITIHKRIHLTEISEELVREIHKMAPFGTKNPKPVFHLKDFPQQVRQIGATNNHLKMQFKNKDQQIEGIGFQMGHLFYQIAKQTPISIIGKLGINEWNGTRKVQMLMDDIRIDEFQLFDFRGRSKKQDISAYIIPDRSHLLVAKEPLLQFENYEGLKQITYDTPLDSLQTVDTVFLFDLPPNLEILKKIIQQTNPNMIHCHYYVENSAYLNYSIDRDSFKWVYAVLLKKQELNLNRDLPLMMKQKGWTKERILFILQVFMELGFIKKENSKILINKNARKKDLHESTLLQNKLLQMKVEKTLYYSNYPQLKKWFDECLLMVSPSEEAVGYGL